MQEGLVSRKLPALLSVRLSNAWVVTKRKKICPAFYTVRKVIEPSFLRKRMVGWLGTTLCTWNVGSTGPRWSEITYFEPIFTRSASAVTPSEKKYNKTNRKSTTLRFPISLRGTSYVAQKGTEKRETAVFGVNRIRLKKLCYKVSLCENCRRQSCTAFINLTIRVKNDSWGATLSTWNFGWNWPRWSEIADYRSILLLAPP